MFIDIDPTLRKQQLRNISNIFCIDIDWTIGQ